MRCCGSESQAITVQTGAGVLALLRCVHCGDQRWARDGAMLARGEAFRALAQAFTCGSQPVPATARAAAQARKAARAAVSAPAPVSEPAPRADLSVLLEGWTVLRVPA